MDARLKAGMTIEKMTSPAPLPTVMAGLDPTIHAFSP